MTPVDSLPEQPETLRRTVSIAFDEVVLPTRYNCEDIVWGTLFFATVFSGLMSAIAHWFAAPLLDLSDLFKLGLLILGSFIPAAINGMCLGLACQSALAMSSLRSYNLTSPKAEVGNITGGVIGHIVFSFAYIVPWLSMLEDLGLGAHILLIVWGVLLGVTVVCGGLWSRRQGAIRINNDLIQWTPGWRLFRRRARQEWSLFHDLRASNDSEAHGLQLNTENLFGTDVFTEALRGITLAERVWLERWVNQQLQIRTQQLGVIPSPTEPNDIPDALNTLRGHTKTP